MTDYNDKSKDDLIEILEERDQSISDMKDEIFYLRESIDESISSSEGLELKIEKAFGYGYNACCDGKQKLKSWLNFKVEERL